MISDSYAKINARFILLDRVLNNYSIAKSQKQTSEEKELADCQISLSTITVPEKQEDCQMLENNTQNESSETKKSELGKLNVENLTLKKKYLNSLREYNLLNQPRLFQVYHVFKNKIKRMYRVDCMTRKLNV